MGGENRRRQIRGILVVINYLHVLAIFVLAYNFYWNNKNYESFFGISVISVDKGLELLVAISISFLIITTYLVYELIKIEELEINLAREKIERDLAESNLRMLRCHRHDFLNHLQVILGYIQLGRNSSAINYIKGINQELKGIRVISGLKMPEMAVMLLSKKQEASRHGIKFHYQLNTDLSETKIKEQDLTRVVSNLIDNAIYELKDLDKNKERIINVKLEVVGETLFIEVFNTESYIASKESIFNYGYTTKGKSGSGIGLYIVKDLVENRYKGKIDVFSDRGSGTCFKIMVNL